MSDAKSCSTVRSKSESQLMPGDVVSIGRRAVTTDTWAPSPWPLNRRGDEASLIRRVLSFAMAPKGDAPLADPRLIELASTLLEAHLSRGRFFSQDLFAEPVWAMMLFVYVHQGRSVDVSITSLCDSRLIGPASVALRWIAKLLTDRVFELTEGEAQPGDALVRLSCDAQKNFEEWLRFVEARLAGNGPQPLKLNPL